MATRGAGRGGRGGRGTASAVDPQTLVAQREVELEALHAQLRRAEEEAQLHKAEAERQKAEAERQKAEAARQRAIDKAEVVRLVTERAAAQKTATEAQRRETALQEQIREQRDKSLLLLDSRLKRQQQAHQAELRAKEQQAREADKAHCSEVEAAKRSAEESRQREAQAAKEADEVARAKQKADEARKEAERKAAHARMEAEQAKHAAEAAIASAQIEATERARMELEAEARVAQEANANAKAEAQRAREEAEADARCQAETAAAEAARNRDLLAAVRQREEAERGAQADAHYRESKAEALDPRAVEARRLAVGQARTDARAQEAMRQEAAAADAAAQEAAAKEEVEARERAAAAAAAELDAQVEGAIQRAARSSQLSAACFSAPPRGAAGSTPATVYLVLGPARSRVQPSYELSAAAVKAYDSLPRMPASSSPISGELFGVYDLLDAPGARPSYAQRGKPDIKLRLQDMKISGQDSQFWDVRIRGEARARLVSNVKPAGAIHPLDQVEEWYEVSEAHGPSEVGKTPLCSAVHSIDEHLGREMLVLTRELQLRQTLTAVTAADVVAEEAGQEATRLAATPPSGGKAAWMQARADKQKAHKAAMERHNAVQGELLQLEQVLEVEAEWLAETYSTLKARRVVAATAALREAVRVGDSTELMRQVRKGGVVNAMQPGSTAVAPLELDVHDLPTFVARPELGGCNVLMSACRFGKTECARLLLREGATVNAANSHGVTALHLASAHGHKGCAELLLEAGASLQARAGNMWKDGYSPVSVARGECPLLLRNALPAATAVPQPSWLDECAVCGQTSADMGDEAEWLRMPCSGTSISQVLATAGDDARLRMRLQQHVMCGSCARQAVTWNDLRCGICHDPCIPSPDALQHEAEQVASCTAHAWATVNRALAAQAYDEHVQAAEAAVAAAEAISGEWALPAQELSEYGLSARFHGEAVQRARDAVAVLAGRYMRRRIDECDKTHAAYELRGEPAARQQAAQAAYDEAWHAYDAFADKFDAVQNDDASEIDYKLMMDPDGITCIQDGPFFPGSQEWKESLQEMLADPSDQELPVSPQPGSESRKGEYASAALRVIREETEDTEYFYQDRHNDAIDEIDHDWMRARAALCAVQALPLLADGIIDGEDPATKCCPVCQETRLWQDGKWQDKGGCCRWLRLPCSHTLCVSCAISNAKERSTCPECREPFLPKPSTGDRVRCHFPPKHVGGDDGKKGGKGGGGGEDDESSKSMWEMMQDLLHLKSGVVLGAAGEGSCSIRLDAPVVDEESGMGIETVRVPLKCLLLVSALVPAADEAAWPSLTAQEEPKESAGEEEERRLPGVSAEQESAMASLLSHAALGGTGEQAEQEEQGGGYQQPRTASELRALCLLTHWPDVYVPEDAGTPTPLGKTLGASSRLLCAACCCWRPRSTFSKTQRKGSEGAGCRRRFTGRCAECLSADLPVRRIDALQTDAGATAAAGAHAAAAEAAAAVIGAQQGSDEAGPSVEAEEVDETEAEAADTAALAAQEDEAYRAAAAIAAVADSADRAAGAAYEAEKRTYEIAKMAHALREMDPDLPGLVVQLAERALENAGRQSTHVTASHKGVSLARNVLAKASGERAHQALEQARSALEDYPPRCEEVLSMAEAARDDAHRCKMACDAQLQDSTLLVDSAGDGSSVNSSQATSSRQLFTVERREKLCDERDAFTQLEATATKLQEDALELSVAQAEELGAVHAAAGPDEDYEDPGHDEDDEEPADAGGHWRPAASGPKGVQEALEHGKWARDWSHTGGHLIYHRRVIKLEDPQMLQVQNWSRSCTPSDHRSYKNMLGDLKRLDDGVWKAFWWSDEQGDVSADFAEEHELQQRRKQLQGDLEMVDMELAEVHSRMDF